MRAGSRAYDNLMVKLFNWRPLPFGVEIAAPKVSQVSIAVSCPKAITLSQAEHLACY